MFFVFRSCLPGIKRESDVIAKCDGWTDNGGCSSNWQQVYLEKLEKNVIFRAVNNNISWGETFIHVYLSQLCQHEFSILTEL